MLEGIVGEISLRALPFDAAVAVAVAVVMVGRGCDLVKDKTRVMLEGDTCVRPVNHE